VRTDTIFYQLLLTYPHLLFELVNLPPDSAHGYQFISVEVKETAFRFDGIFFPNTADKTIWFVEVQFQKVADFYSQFMAEIMRYLKQYQPVQDWRAVVIYPNRQTEAPVPDHCQEWFATQRLTAVYLNELTRETPYIGLTKLIITPEEQVIEPAQELVRRYGQVGGLLEFVATILAYKLKHLSREAISAMFTMGDLKQTRVYQDAYREALEKGKQEGKQEGMQEGRREGKVQTILRLLSRKFGNLSPHITQQIANLSLESLDSLADVILDMQNLDDLNKWLSSR
jgi:predicted transposase/invertase (TIGR01784 family)